MGKKRKNKQRNNKQGGGGQYWKRPRREKYWIEDCRDTKGVVPSDARLTLLITRSDLEDAFRHAKAKERSKDDQSHTSDGNQENLSLKVKEASAVREEDTEKNACKEDTDSNTSQKDKETNTNDTIAGQSLNSASQDDQDEACQQLKEHPAPHSVPDEPPKETTARNEEDPATSLAGLQDVTDKSHCEESPFPSNPGGNPKDNLAGNGDESDESDTSESPFPSNPDENVPKKKKAKKKNICIRLDASFKKDVKKFARQNYQNLSDGDCGDGIKNPFPKHVVADKYWAQRHRLFSRFDHGVQLDAESWFSVTPEKIANHIADKVVEKSTAAKSEGGLVVLDPCCGAGGNSIAFAKQAEVSLVVCVDLDPSKLKLAAQNAKIYEIPPDKLLFICGDVFDVLAQYLNGKLVKANDNKAGDLTTDIHGYRLGDADALPETIGSIFLSPPWGGVNYESIGSKKFDLKCVQFNGEQDGEQLIEHAARALPPKTGAIACFLPRNTNGFEVGLSALKVGISGTLEVEQNMLNDKFKAITFYLGKAKEHVLHPS
ncbi:Trimethylguanosine synthase [Seminavis robusta]|uniref:Trimethylguanosine synthase n=1 Tax=Seminavis robusta TaxID=568900 RepID=A0A9N8HCQ9_9STRA|nr:Trimethylguanosine synthase [Seminavis robusta]|eukprot:Sro229_g092940.1 Trimethylguanosine synthase (545) ;mRNA; r:22454-24171